MRINKTVHVPLDIAKFPMSGECICDNYWISHPDYGLCFYAPNKISRSDDMSPSCNSDERVSLKLLGPLYNNDELYDDDYEVVFIDVVYSSSCLKYGKDL